MIYTERSQLHNKATRIMRDVAMLLLLLLLCIPLSNAVTICTFQEDSGTTNKQEEASGDSDCFMKGRGCYKRKLVYKLKNGN